MLKVPETMQGFELTDMTNLESRSAPHKVREPRVDARGLLGVGEGTQEMRRFDRPRNRNSALRHPVNIHPGRCLNHRYG